MYKIYNVNGYVQNTIYSTNLVGNHELRASIKLLFLS